MKKEAIVAVVAVQALLAAGVVIAGPFTFEQKPGASVYSYVDREQSANADVHWVDSGNANASDATNHGYHPNFPYATVDYAVGRCAANNHCVIFVMPGHNETCGAACVDADVAGVHIVGLGEGQDRPRFDYDANTGTFIIGAASVTIENLTFMPGVTSVATAIVVEAGGDNATIKNCEFLVGEAAGTDEFVSAITINGGANDVHIVDNVFQTDPADNGCTNAINIGVGGAAVERPVIEGNLVYGNYSTAAIIDGGTAFTEGWIMNNKMKVKDGEPGIELAATSTAVIYNNIIESTGVTCDSAIVAADGAWFRNWCVRADGGAATEIGVTTPDEINTDIDTILANVNAGNTVLNGLAGNTAVGSRFTIVKTVTHNTIVAAGIDITGASSGGTLRVIDITIMNGQTIVDSAGHGAVLEFYTNDAGYGYASFATVSDVDPLVAGAVISSCGTAGDGYDTMMGLPVLASGQKIKLKATTEDVTSVGTLKVFITFERVTAGATVSAA